MSGDDSDEPDWDLLPWEPERFFGLVQPYTLADLKRRYNQRLRRYKPDRHMTEFMRLRAAYEALERELRGIGPFSGSITPPPESPSVLPKPEAEQSSESSFDQSLGDRVPVEEGDPFENVAPPLGVWRTDERAVARERSKIRRPEGASLDDTLKRLREDPSLISLDYIDLALDIDNRPFRSPEFLTVLLEGLARWPECMELNCLLREYFEFGPESELLAIALQKASVYLRADHFFRESGKAWHRLLRQIPTSDFVALFDECAGFSRSGLAFDELSVICSILPNLVWEASPEWVESYIVMIDAISVGRNPLLDLSIDRLDTLWRYVRDTGRFSADSTLRNELEELIRASFDPENRGFAEKFLRFQIGIRNREAAWLDGFSLWEKNSCDPSLSLFAFMDSAVSGCLSSRGRSDHPLTYDDVLAYALSRDGDGVVQEILENLKTSSLWNNLQNMDFEVRSVVPFFLSLPILLAVMFAFAQLAGMLVFSIVHAVDAMDVFWKGLMTVCATLSMIVWVFHPLLTPRTPQWCKRLHKTIQHRRVFRRYRARFRPRFLARMTEAGWGYRTSLDHLSQVKHTLPEWIQLMVDLWSRDFGVAIVLTARLYGTKDPHSPSDGGGRRLETGLLESRGD
jgi:hypothetical protein